MEHAEVFNRDSAFLERRQEFYRVMPSNPITVMQDDHLDIELVLLGCVDEEVKAASTGYNLKKELLDQGSISNGDVESIQNNVLSQEKL